MNSYHEYSTEQELSFIRRLGTHDSSASYSLSRLELLRRYAKALTGRTVWAQLDAAAVSAEVLLAIQQEEQRAEAALKFFDQQREGTE